MYGLRKVKIRLGTLNNGRYLHGAACRGYTMIEAVVAVVIIGVLVSLAAPLYSKAIEQARLDSAAGNLKTVWSAQRAYWLKNHTFASSLTLLEDESLISASLAQTQTLPNAMYIYDIDSAGDSSFAASAVRDGSGVWSGQIQIDETGEITGQISKDGGFTLLPFTLE
jgi:prepilin-type N-terminal cleavage/methylation domain-containing protein